MSKPNRVFGLHSLKTALLHQPERVHRIWVQDSRRDARLEEILKLAERSDVSCTPATRHELDKLADGGRHQGVVADVELPRLRDEKELGVFLDELAAAPFLLILDGVQDPHNMGACLRSADAAGVQAVIVPRDRAAGLTPVVVKVASGATGTLPVFGVTNLARVLDALKKRGIWIYGAAGEADVSCYETDLSGPLALVLGSEGRGLRRLTRERCDGLIHIPMAGHVESLNVSVATGVLLFEAVRQRSQE